MSATSGFVLYSNIVPLDREEFKDFRLSEDTSYAFAARVNSVPVTGDEFTIAGREYPIVFVSGENDQYMPAVMLGVKSDENLYVSPGGAWLGRYIPLYVRQYPLMAATMPGDERLTVCVDRDYIGLEGRGEPLFDDQGNESVWLAEGARGAAEYHMRMQKTVAFCQRLASLDLFVPLDPELKNTKTGDVTLIKGVYGVDENRLNHLSDRDAVDLFRQGDLARIYLHLASLLNFADLANK